MGKSFAGILIVILLTVLVALTSTDGASAQVSCNFCADDHCVKYESPPWIFDVGSQNVSYIRRVEIKAGNACYVFNEDGSDGCYEVSGVGGKVATVRQVSEGPDCLGISHVLFYWWSPVLDTPTPTATEGPTPTNTPSPTNTPEPTVTNTPPPDSTPTPTNTPNPEWTPTPTEPAQTPTLTLPPQPSPTPQNTPTSTPRPNPKQGTMRGYLFCVYGDGTQGQGRSELVIKTDNIGVVCGYPLPWGYVGTWPTARDTGTTVLSAGPGDCVRGGDNWPDDPTEYSLEEMPIFGAGNVGNSAVICRESCVDSSTFFLPTSGASFAQWCIELVLKLLPF